MSLVSTFVDAFKSSRRQPTKPDVDMKCSFHSAQRQKGPPGRSTRSGRHRSPIRGRNRPWRRVCDWGTGGRIGRSGGGWRGEPALDGRRPRPLPTESRNFIPLARMATRRAVPVGCEALRHRLPPDVPPARHRGPVELQLHGRQVRADARMGAARVLLGALRDRGGDLLGVHLRARGLTARGASPTTGSWSWPPRSGSGSTSSRSLTPCG